MNARIAQIEAMAVSEEAEELAVEELIRSTGGTCGIVPPVDFCSADSLSELESLHQKTSHDGFSRTRVVSEKEP